jgi:DNA-directed RNA polymerase specialized sigma24 family protein
MFETHRASLSCYARRLLDRTLAHRIDLSGVVQQTLADASVTTVPAEGLVRHWLRTLLRRNYLVAARREGDGRRDRPLEAAAASPCRGTTRASRRPRRAGRCDRGTRGPAPHQREVVRLRHLEGHGLDAVAAMTGRSRPAVAGLLRRGLEALRGRLDPCPPREWNP